MTINFEKSSINLKELKMNESSVLLVEGDVIVPDVSPDIKKILMTDADSSITGKRFENGKITIDGTVSANVLYEPETAKDGDAKIKSLCTKLSFSETFPFAEENPSISAKSEIISVNCTLINSRKINLKITVRLHLKAYTDGEFCYLSKPQDEKAETKKVNVSILTTPVDVQKEFVFSESISVPDAKCDIEELLKTNIDVIKGECKISEGEINLKGTVHIKTLYCGFTDSFIHETMEHELPFTETLSVEGLCDECLCNVTYDVRDTSVICRKDENGDMRELLVSVTVCANISASRIYDLELIEDLFFPGKVCTLKQEKKVLKRSLEEGSNRVSFKNMFALNDKAPKLSKVYSIISNPVTTAHSFTDDKLTISGEITATVLYSDTEGALHSQISKFPFSYEFDTAFPEGEIMCEYDISNLGTSFNIYSETEVEIRTNVEFFLRLYENFTLNMINECEISEDAAPSHPSQLYIYFVQKGDTLWEIAKRYNTKVSSIKFANKLDTDMIIPGQKLLIPVR